MTETNSNEDKRRSTTGKREVTRRDGNIKFLPLGPYSRRGDAVMAKPTFKVGLLHGRMCLLVGAKKFTSPDPQPPYDDFGDVDNDLGGVFSSCYMRAPYGVYLLSSLMGMRG